MIKVTILIDNNYETAEISRIFSIIFSLFFDKLFFSLNKVKDLFNGYIINNIRFQMSFKLFLTFYMIYYLIIILNMFNYVSITQLEIVRFLYKLNKRLKNLDNFPIKKI